MSVRKCLPIFFLCASPFFAVVGQTNRIAISKKSFYTAASVSEKLDAALALCRESYSINLDTLYYYASFARQAAMRLGDKKRETLASTYIETWLGRKNLFDSVLVL